MAKPSLSRLASAAAQSLLVAAVLLFFVAPADARGLSWAHHGGKKNEGTVTIVQLPAQAPVFAPPPQLVNIYVPRTPPIAYPYPVPVAVAQPCAVGCNGDSVVGGGGGCGNGGGGFVGSGSGCGPSAIGIDTSTVVRNVGKK